MKSSILKGLSVLMVAFSLISASSLASAHCRWQNGHRVCWHNTYHHAHCKWVQSHWHNGHHVPAHKVCWR